jgi:hypothetical protein
VDKTDTLLIRQSIANLELQIKDPVRNGGVFIYLLLIDYLMLNRCDPSALGEANSSNPRPLRRGILGSGFFGDCEMLYL